MAGLRKGGFILLAHLGLGVLLGALGSNFWTSNAFACSCSDATWTLEFLSIEGDSDTSAERGLWSDHPWIYGARGFATFYDGQFLYELEIAND